MEELAASADGDVGATPRGRPPRGRPARGRPLHGRPWLHLRPSERKIALYGSDSDPRAFNFDGEFNVANRGLIEFVEVLKLDVAFLYDLLCASQEHVIKPKKPQTALMSDHRPHQRAGIPQAAGQRIHGSLA
jgi:hypothetical protein